MPCRRAGARRVVEHGDRRRVRHVALAAVGQGPEPGDPGLARGQVGAEAGAVHDRAGHPLGEPSALVVKPPGPTPWIATRWCTRRFSLYSPRGLSAVGRPATPRRASSGAPSSARRPRAPPGRWRTACPGRPRATFGLAAVEVIRWRGRDRAEVPDGHAVVGRPLGAVRDRHLEGAAAAGRDGGNGERDARVGPAGDGHARHSCSGRVRQGDRAGAAGRPEARARHGDGAVWRRAGDGRSSTGGRRRAAAGRSCRGCSGPGSTRWCPGASTVAAAWVGAVSVTV